MIIICFGTVTRPLFLFNPLPMMFKTTKKRKNSSGNFQCGILPVQLRRPKLLFHQQVPRGANSLEICDDWCVCTVHCDYRISHDILSLSLAALSLSVACGRTRDKGVPHHGPWTCKGV